MVSSMCSIRWKSSKFRSSVSTSLRSYVAKYTSNSIVAVRIERNDNPNEDHLVDRENIVGTSPSSSRPKVSRVLPSSASTLIREPSCSSSTCVSATSEISGNRPQHHPIYSPREPHWKDNTSQKGQLVWSPAHDF